MSLKKNIIYLHFKGKHLITSKSQYQYNYGQYLYFTDLNLPQAFEVHFSNKERGESETQIGSNKLVEIPDKFFWSGALEIYAWVYLHNETDDGETIYEVRIPLIKRARPTDKEPLPDQQSAIDKAIAELNNAVNITNENADKTNADKTQVVTIKEEVVVLKEEINSTASAVSQDAQNANIAAERSEQFAQNSAESERKALDYSDEAKSYAQSALESKGTASQKAQIATNASAEAKDFRDEAETFKNEAEQIKQNVVDYRNETKGYRDEALTAKNDAQDSANAAQETLEQVTQAGEEIIESVRDLGSRYATQAETAANNAQTSAESASVSATASAQSASQSAQIKSDVEGLTEDAQDAANSSEVSARASNGFASQAQGFARQAESYANGASGYASDAQASASTASAKATESAQSASQALSYKTDAESAKTASQTAQGLAESARDSAITAKNDAESARDDAVQAKTDVQNIADGIDTRLVDVESALIDKAPVITDTASGSIARFPDGADNLPLKSLVVDINPVQDLSHGDPSPENICPISGWTEVGVNQTGVNVWDEEWEVGGIRTADGTLINEQRIRSKNLIPCVPNTTYYILDPTNNDNIRVFYYAKNGSYIGCTSFIMGAQTTPNNARFMRFIIATTYGTTYNHDISINYPSTDHNYHSYAGQSITINLGQTVYGGKLDVLSGVLTVDMAMVDLGTLTWTYETSKPNYNFFYAPIADKKKGGASISSMYPYVGTSWTTLTNDCTMGNFGSESNRIAIRDDSYMDATAFKTAMSGVQLCYELAEPIEIQLSANQVNSLLGVNNLWADSGDTEVEYRADTKLYIAKKIAEAIASLT